MIAYLKGILTEATPVSAVVEVNGIGYALTVPVTTAEKLPSMGQTVTLLTVPVYREDSQALYGFATAEERDFFRLLVEKVSGIGPRIAISILSKLSVPVLRQAIAAGDVALLAKCPGIGKKTAERLVVELKDKVGLGSAEGSGWTVPGAAPNLPAQSPEQDAVAALVALGYKLADADKAVRKAADKLGADANTETLIRAALG